MATIEGLLGPLANNSAVKPLIDNQVVQPIVQNEYGLFLLVIVAFLIIGGIFHFVLRGFFHGLTKKTKTDLDDRIFDIIKLPIFAIINIFGFYTALTTLSFLEDYLFYLEGGFFVLSALIAAHVGTKIVGLVVSRQLSNGDENAPNLVIKIVDIVIYLIVLLAILSHFGVDITAGIAALGVGGIAIGLALQGTLSNFFSGLHIVTDKPVRVGDYIEVASEGVEGYVTDVGWRSTRVRTLPNNLVIIPNSKLAESVIVNNSLTTKDMSFTIDCGVAYDSDVDQVEKVALEVAKDVQENVDGAVKGYNPLFRFKEFGDSNINFYVVLRIEQFVDKYGVRNEFIKRLKNRFDKEGIEISWPVRKIFYGEEKKPEHHAHHEHHEHHAHSEHHTHSHK